jgi:hypothetical protein
VYGNIQTNIDVSHRTRFGVAPPTKPEPVSLPPPSFTQFTLPAGESPLANAQALKRQRGRGRPRSRTQRSDDYLTTMQGTMNGLTDAEAMHPTSSGTFYQLPAKVPINNFQTPVRATPAKTHPTLLPAPVDQSPNSNGTATPTKPTITLKIRPHVSMRCHTLNFT